MIPLADEAATIAAGRALGTLLRGGDAVALVGDLGAGKTTFVGGVVAAVDGGVASSPTFSLVNEYPGGRLVIWHVDLYRLEREAELVELGLDDIVGERRGACLIEWADKFAVMPRDHLRVELGHGDAKDPTAGRTLELRGTGPRGLELASALEAELLGLRR